jgi:NADH dehydrogenase
MLARRLGGPRALHVITGANGHLGRALIQRLAGRKLRAVVRSPRAAAVLRALPEVPEVSVVDYADADALAAAAGGADAVVHLVGILKETRTARYRDAHEGTARALASAARQAGFRRVVYLSILGAHAGSTNDCLASKARAEAILLESPLDTTVLRVPMVLGGDEPASRALRARARARVVPLVRGGASLEQPIDAGDVVEAILGALARPELGGRTLDLAGPESLSQRELVRRAAGLLGRPPPLVVPVPLAAARALAALAERVLADPPLTPAMLGVLDHDDRVDPAPACRALGVTLTPLDDTLRRCLEESP